MLAAGDVHGGVTRQYYMAAERELFNHIPLGADACDGTLQPLDSGGAARAFNNASAETVGSQRFRATFFQYTDATFTTRKVSPSIRNLLHAHHACCPCFCARASAIQYLKLRQPNCASCSLWQGNEEKGLCHDVSYIKAPLT